MSFFRKALNKTPKPSSVTFKSKKSTANKEQLTEHDNSLTNQHEHQTEKVFDANTHVELPPSSRSIGDTSANHFGEVAESPAVVKPPITPPPPPVRSSMRATPPPPPKRDTAQGNDHEPEQVPAGLQPGFSLPIPGAEHQSAVQPRVPPSPPGSLLYKDLQTALQTKGLGKYLEAIQSLGVVTFEDMSKLDPDDKLETIWTSMSYLDRKKIKVLVNQAKEVVLSSGGDQCMDPVHPPAVPNRASAIEAQIPVTFNVDECDADKSTDDECDADNSTDDEGDDAFTQNDYRSDKNTDIEHDEQSGVEHKLEKVVTTQPQRPLSSGYTPPPRLSPVSGQLPEQGVNDNSQTGEVDDDVAGVPNTELLSSLAGLAAKRLSERKGKASQPLPGNKATIATQTSDSDLLRTDSVVSEFATPRSANIESKVDSSKELEDMVVQAEVVALKLTENTEILESKRKVVESLQIKAQDLEDQLTGTLTTMYEELAEQREREESAIAQQQELQTLLANISTLQQALSATQPHSDLLDENETTTVDGHKHVACGHDNTIDRDAAPLSPTREQNSITTSGTTILSNNEPLSPQSDGSCKGFKLDKKSMFGTCICGKPRVDHNSVTESQSSESKASEACSDFRLDMSASTFNTCSCGWPKAEHITLGNSKPSANRWKSMEKAGSFKHT